MTIVKVQVALFPAGAPALVYAKGKRNMVQQEISQGARDALKGDAKGYFEAEFDGKEWKIGSRTMPQAW